MRLASPLVLALVLVVGQGEHVASTGDGDVNITPGCYIDKGPIGSNQPERQMSHQVCEGTGMCAALTHANCADACRAAGFALFGVEAGHQCYCDNSLKVGSVHLEITHVRFTAADGTFYLILWFSFSVF